VSWEFGFLLLFFCFKVFLLFFFLRQGLTYTAQVGLKHFCVWGVGGGEVCGWGGVFRGGCVCRCVWVVGVCVGGVGGLWVCMGVGGWGCMCGCAWV
jgi:hypothetical protein